VRLSSASTLHITPTEGSSTILSEVSWPYPSPHTIITQHLIFTSPCIFNIFPKCNQQDATFLNLFIYFHPSPGAQTLHIASSICQTLRLTAARRNFSSIPTMIAAVSCKVWQIPEAICTVWAPDDGRRNRLKNVQHFIEINKLRNVASCWLHFGNILHSNNKKFVDFRLPPQSRWDLRSSGLWRSVQW
jgi:hypothetical protein